MYTNWLLPDNEELLINAVASSQSIAEVCRSLGLAPKGGNYKTIKHHITRLNLSTDHHLGQAWNRENYAEPSASRHKGTLKQYIIRENGHKCEQCGLSEWQGEPIPLEMDHINGKNNDNRLDNLRILCCNCHALTPTWRNKKR